MNYPTDLTRAFVPEATGQVVNVTAEDVDLLILLFGECAPDVQGLLAKPFRHNRWVQLPPRPGEDAAGGPV